MHTVHVLVINHASGERVLVPEDDSGVVAPWSDWHEIGGRWNGFFDEHDEAKTLEDGNVLPLADNIGVARKVLTEVCQMQDAAFLEMRDHMAGNPVAVADFSGHFLGFPVAPDEASARRRTAYNQQVADEWASVLASGSLNEARAAATIGGAMYQARRLSEMVNEEWNPQSGFYNTVGYTTNPVGLLDALPLLDADPDAQYCHLTASEIALVAVDFHY